MDPVSEAGTARGHAWRRLLRARRELDDAFTEFITADSLYNHVVAQQHLEVDEPS